MDKTECSSDYACHFVIIAQGSGCSVSRAMSISTAATLKVWPDLLSNSFRYQGEEGMQSESMHVSKPGDP